MRTRRRYTKWAGHYPPPSLSEWLADGHVTCSIQCLNGRCDRRVDVRLDTLPQDQPWSRVGLCLICSACGAAGSVHIVPNWHHSCGQVRPSMGAWGSSSRWRTSPKALSPILRLPPASLCSWLPAPCRFRTAASTLRRSTIPSSTRWREAARVRRRHQVRRREGLAGAAWERHLCAAHYARLGPVWRSVRNRAMATRFAVSLALSFGLAERPRHYLSQDLPSRGRPFHFARLVPGPIPSTGRLDFPLSPCNRNAATIARLAPPTRAPI